MNQLSIILFIEFFWCPYEPTPNEVSYVLGALPTNVGMFVVETDAPGNYSSLYKLCFSILVVSLIPQLRLHCSISQCTHDLYIDMPHREY